MRIEVNESALIRLLPGTLSSGPEDAHLDELVVYPDDNILFTPTDDDLANYPEHFEDGDERKILWFDDGVLNGFYIEEIISITEI